MRITKKRPSPKLFLLAAAVVAVVGAGGYAVYQRMQPAQTIQEPTSQPGARPVNDVDYSSPSEQEKAEAEQQKEDIIEQYEQSQNPSTSQDISVTISRANQVGAGQPLNVRTIINGTSGGTCVVTLTKSGQATVEKTFPITIQATYATCQNADIPASAFAVGGEWQISIVARTDDAQSAPAAQTVTIEK